ncbi:MAG TPA: methylmalonyl Co-A mutase-associated GTPase MeaB [Acidimicrobiales bacterium]
MAASSPGDLLAAARGGDRAALGRLLSIVERGGDGARQVGRLTRGLGGDAYTIGITGSPGAGKSTLTSALVATVRGTGDRVAVLAIDPSSPFSGGAILGDRVRMGDHALDDGVFIRSMASRGHLGGLAVAAPEAVRLLTAVGFPWVVLETVGVGQVEVEVVGQSDTTVVVVTPGWGDAVQANKAGLMEIADVFVVNKADRPGADETVRDLERMLDLAGSGDGGWRPPVVATTATTGRGVEEVWRAIGAHRAHLEAGGGLAERRRRRAADEVTRLVVAALMARARAATDGPRAAELAEAIARGNADPWSAADELLGDLDPAPEPPG